MSTPIKKLSIAFSAVILAVSGSLMAITPSAAAAGMPAKIRIGYFANVTHAPALIAAQKKLWKKYLPGVKIEPFIFNAGPAAIEAMKGGALDVTYIGPNPAITGYNSTNGTLLRIISGATSGGAQFITKQSIKTLADLKGTNIATPQLGNTQDVALRSYLASKNLTVGKDVTITPTENSVTLTLFKNNQIDGAWVPEPWASRLVLEGNGRVFLDEKTLWAGGKFLTTNIVATKTFLEKFPKAVSAVLKANQAALKLIKNKPAVAKDLAQAELLKQTGKKLSDEVINRAWSNLTFTSDPLAKTLTKNADDAIEAGLLKLKSAGLRNIYDLRLLNSIRVAEKAKPFSAAGNGKQ